MKDVKIVRLQTIGDSAILIISKEWLYISEDEQKIVLRKELSNIIEGS